MHTQIFYILQHFGFGYYLQISDHQQSVDRSLPGGPSPAGGRWFNQFNLTLTFTCLEPFSAWHTNITFSIVEAWCFDSQLQWHIIIDQSDIIAYSALSPEWVNTSSHLRIDGLRKQVSTLLIQFSAWSTLTLQKLEGFRAKASRLKL